MKYTIIFAASVFLTLSMTMMTCSISRAWDGPAQSPGAGLGSLFKPTNFIDATGLGTWGNNPYIDSRLRLNYILSQTQTDTIQLNARGERFHLDEDLPLASVPSTVPRDLWNVDFGATYSHKMEKGEWGVIATLGSDSDLPFNSIHEITGTLTGTYTFPTDKLHSWIFFLSYANNRAFAPGIPLPGASYLVIDPINHVEISYGLPFFIAWQPTPDWNYKLVYFLPNIIDAEISYQFFSPFKAHVNFTWLPQTWLPAGRTDYSNTLILDQMKASAGVRVPIASDWYTDFVAGYAFDQVIFEAEELFSTGITKTYLDAGVFAQAEVAYRF
jgi:hypothetical protein